MKKTLVNIIAILVIVAGTFGATRQWFPRTVDNTVVDTVRVDVPYKVTKIKEVEKPIRVTEYKTKYDTVEKVRVERDTIYVDTNLDTFTYNTRFLTNYPSAPKFLGLEDKDGKVGLTYLRTNGVTRTKTWEVGSRGYRIGLSDGQPNIETFSEASTDFSYSVQAGYIRFFSQGSPYLELNTEINIFGIRATGTLNANQNPFGMVGVEYKF